MPLTVSGGYYASNTPHSLTFGTGLPQRLRGTNLTLSIKQSYFVIREDDPERGPWRVTIRRYSYSIGYTEDDPAEHKPQELIAYHWHPDDGAKVWRTHLHLGPASGTQKSGLYRTHVPTGRVAVEDVVRYAIDELGAAPLREDWQDILDESQRAYERYRSWGGSGPTNLS